MGFHVDLFSVLAFLVVFFVASPVLIACFSKTSNLKIVVSQAITTATSLFLLTSLHSPWATLIILVPTVLYGVFLASQIENL